MKLFAQHGYGDGNKLNEGFDNDYIQGVIFRPRDISPSRLIERCAELVNNYPNKEIIFDPQQYAATILHDPNTNLGKLEEYDSYIERLILSRLEREQYVVDVLHRTNTWVLNLDVTAIITPNILIRRSFDSRDAVIAKNFIRLSNASVKKRKKRQPIYATLAIHRDALINKTELQEFLNDITVLDNPPDGFYILIAARSSEARSEILQDDVIAGWMLLNYSLHVNGFKIINGYSDLLSPFLGIAGGDAGCTGWWSNARTFSIDQFIVSSSGGRLPIQRYLSKSLINRIRFDEYHAWRNIAPAIINKLDSDNLYTEEGGEPERAKEVLQSWQTLQTLMNEFSRNNLQENLQIAEKAIQHAVDMYDTIESSGIRPDIRSNRDHLDPLQEGINLFKKFAEI